MGTVTDLHRRAPYEPRHDPFAQIPCDMELREPCSDWDNLTPLRTSYQTELAAESRRRWMRRLTMTGTVVVFGAVFALWLLQQLPR